MLTWVGQRQNDGSMEVLRAIDFVDVHTLPFFSHEASTGKLGRFLKCYHGDSPRTTTAWASWPIVMKDLNWFFSNSGGKKIYLSQVPPPESAALAQPDTITSHSAERLAIG